MPVLPRRARRPSAGGPRSASPLLLAGVLGAAGVLHLVRPKPFSQLIPRQLPSPYAWVYASGVAELACAAGLVVPRTRRRAGWATAALFVGVFPGNVQMALDSGRGSTAYRTATYARLPLQVPLVLWAARIARRSG